MKKFLAVLLSFMLVFTSTTSVFVFAKTGSTRQFTPDIKVELSAGLTQTQLSTLFKGSGLNQDGIAYIAGLRGTTYAKLMQDYQDGKLSAKSLLAIIINGGLSKDELGALLDEDGVTESGIDYLESIGVIEDPKPTIPVKDLEISIGGPEDEDRTPLTVAQVRSVGLEGFVEDEGEGEWKINFKNITSANAGKVVKVWEGKENFPKKMILENGINLKVNEMDVDAMFLRTTEIQDEVTRLNNIGTDIGEVIVLEPKLELLPDRIRVTKTTQFTFNDDNQLSNIRENFAIKDDLEEKFDRMSQPVGNYQLAPTAMKVNTKYNVPVKGLAPIQTVVNLEEDFINRDDIIEQQMGEVSALNISEAELEEKVILGLIEICEEEYGEGSNECTESAVETKLASGEKTFESTEEVEISLILPEITNDGLELVHERASDVRMTRVQIISIFNEYTLISQIAQEAYVDDSGPIEIEAPENNPFDDPDHCNGDAECEALQTVKESGAAAHKVQRLLNGFTLGEERSYVFSDKLRVGCCGYNKTLYNIRVEFYYAYGFGLRIPMIAEVITTPALLDNFTEQNATYDVRYKMYTVNGDVDHYEKAGLPAHKMFDAKEFVFKVTAGIKYDIRVIGDFIDEHGEIKLLSLLADFFKDDLQSLFGLTDAQIQSVIDNNGIDKSQDFTPPFVGSQVYELFKGSISVPVRDFGIAKLLAKVGLSVNLRGDIEADCEEVNTNGGCISNKITFSNTDFKSDTGVAYYNPAAQDEDALGVYSNFGVKLDNFWYIPVLVFKIFAAGGVKVKIPARGRETFWTPEITIYEFEFPIDALALGTHEGTIGVVDATEDNKIYATNPEIDKEDPNIIIIGDNHRAQLRFDTNTTDSTFNQYSINTSSNPNCSDKGIRWEPTTYIWQEPYNNVVTTKDFEIKARGCTIYGEGTSVFTESTTLTNEAFDIYISVPEFTREIDSEDKIYLSNRYMINGYLLGRYTLDTPLLYNSDNCLAGEEYEVAQGISVRDTAKETLQNDFDVEVRAMACNADKDILAGRGLVPSREITGGRFTLYTNGDVFTVHNNEFNPYIREGANGRYNISSYRYPVNGYRTYYAYTLNGDVPECYDDNGDGVGAIHDSQIYEEVTAMNPASLAVDIIGISGVGDLEVARPGAEVTFGGIMVIPGAKIKARACIEDPSGHFVFGSDIDTVQTQILGMDIEFEENMLGKVRDMLDHEEIMDIQNGFGNPASDPIFMGAILDGIDAGLFTAGGIAGMARMMGAGQMLPGAMRTMSTSMQGTKSQMESGFRSMLSSRTITANGISSLSSLISSKAIGKEGLIVLSIAFDASISRFDTKGGTDAVIPGIVGMTYTGEERQCEDRNIYSLDPDEGWYLVTRCENGCNDEPRCLTDEEVADEGGIIDTKCEDRNIYNLHSITGWQLSTRCINGCNDEPRCLRNDEVEEDDAEESPRGDYIAPLPTEEELPTTSEDEYINDKLSELNNCFLDLYNNHLQNIDDSIADFKARRDNANTAAEVNKYERAIEKLEEIRELYINRYKVLDEYSEEDEFAVDEDNFGWSIRFGYTSSYSQMEKIRRALGTRASFVVTSETDDGTILYYIYKGGYNNHTTANNDLQSMRRLYSEGIDPTEFIQFMRRFVMGGYVVDYQG